VVLMSQALRSITMSYQQQERMGGVPTEQVPTGTPQKRADGPDGPVQNEQHAQQQQEHGPAPEGARGGELRDCTLCRDKLAQVGFEHCNHVCICIFCAARMGSIGMCPLCRVYSRLLIVA
jgi:hypothetical protein